MIRKYDWKLIVVNVILGVSWKQGQWINEEVEILQSNIINYCKVGIQYVVLDNRECFV